MRQAKQIKSAGRSVEKGSTSKITISLPDGMLQWAEVMAAVRRLERNDVLRMALGNGLMLMQAESIRLTQQGSRVAEEYSQEVGGIEGFKQEVLDSIVADAAKLKKQVGTS